MVSDAVSAPARRSTPYVRRLFLTLFLLALYFYGQKLPLPGIDEHALRSLPIPSPGRFLWSILSLGPIPLFFGFLLVELFSLLTPPGRRLRRLGVAGRARLNRAALITSLLIAGAQAAGIAFWMETMSSPWGSPVVEAPGLGFLLLTTLTLTAATAALFVLCQLISTYGIGNGFALVILMPIVMSILRRGAAVLQNSDSSSQHGLEVLLFLGTLALVVYFIRTAEDSWLPAFPQGTIPALAALVLAPVGVAFVRFFPLGSISNSMVVMVLITIPLLSWLTFHLFSSRSRLQASLFDTDELLDELAAALRRRAGIATALLTLGTAGFMAWHFYHSEAVASSLGFTDVIVLAAIGLDLWDQFRFQRRHGEAALLVQLDNVHFSYRLEEELQEEGIAALARGHQLRSLYFFFGALYKIDMLVPADQLGRAREVLAQLEMAREVRVF